MVFRIFSGGWFFGLAYVACVTHLGRVICWWFVCGFRRGCVCMTQEHFSQWTDEYRSFDEWKIQRELFMNDARHTCFFFSSPSEAINLLPFFLRSHSSALSEEFITYFRLIRLYKAIIYVYNLNLAHTIQTGSSTSASSRHAFVRSCGKPPSMETPQSRAGFLQIDSWKPLKSHWNHWKARGPLKIRLEKDHWWLEIINTIQDIYK